MRASRDMRAEVETPLGRSDVHLLTVRVSPVLTRFGSREPAILAVLGSASAARRRPRCVPRAQSRGVVCGGSRAPPLIRGSACALKANGELPASRGALVVRAPGKRSGWDSASVGHLVCLVQACVKGPLCYVMLCYGAGNAAPRGRRRRHCTQGQRRRWRAARAWAGASLSGGGPAANREFRLLRGQIGTASFGARI